MTTEPRVFTGGDVAEWLQRKAVFEPDRRNPVNVSGTCVYADKSGNHCIVGEWLSDVCGVDDDWLRSSDNNTALAEIVTSKAARVFNFGLTRAAQAVLGKIQVIADTREPTPYAEYVDTSSATFPRRKWGAAVELCLGDSLVQRMIAENSEFETERVA